MGTKTDPPKVFTVGNEEHHDFTPEAIELLTLQIRDWFASPECERTYEEPLLAAREAVEQCLLAQTKSGKIWSRAPDSFESRIMIKTHFDMIDGNHVKNPDKGPRVRSNRAYKAAIDKAKESASPVSLKHIQDYQKQVEEDILKAYPELDNPVHKPNVVRLAMLYAEQEHVRLELPGAKGKARHGMIETLATLQKTITDTMKSLDIYPDQIRKRVDKQRQGSVGDLVALIDEDPDFRAREKRWALTLALQLWWMTKHPNGKNDGPQMHDFEMWHLTRTRPIDYKCSCGREVTLVEGFTPEELRDYLVDNGVLVERPVIENLITEEDLHGLTDYTGSTESTHGNEEEVGGIDAGGSPPVEGVQGS